MRIIEGFYAVEQYAPDYTSELTQLARKDYGHSQFQLRWGAEEEKHADLWRNALLFSRARTSNEVEKYTDDLRSAAWKAPFDTPLEMLFYTVFQERATQLIYQNLGQIAKGIHPDACFSDDKDEALYKAISAIAIDEAAHFDFFLSMARINLYYFPEESLSALVNVLRNFTMPAAQLIANYDEFIKILYEAKIFSPIIYGKHVAKPSLAALGIKTIKEIEEGIRKSRNFPDFNGAITKNPIFSCCNFNVLEDSIIHLFERIGRFEIDAGLNIVDPTTYIANTWST